VREVLISNLPDTRSLTDPAMLEYGRLLNVELDNFNRNLNRYASKVVVSSFTSDGTLTANDELVLCSGTFTVTLPPAKSSEGKVYHIKNTGTGVIKVDGNSSETIDGETDVDLNEDDCMGITSDATEWHII